MHLPRLPSRLALSCEPALQAATGAAAAENFAAQYAYEEDRVCTHQADALSPLRPVSPQRTFEHTGIPMGGKAAAFRAELTWRTTFAGKSRHQAYKKGLLSMPPQKFPCAGDRLFRLRLC